MTEDGTTGECVCPNYAHGDDICERCRDMAYSVLEANRIQEIRRMASTEETACWLQGLVICMSCEYVWRAVRPCGTWGLECPQCHRFAGVARKVLR